MADRSALRYSHKARADLSANHRQLAKCRGVGRHGRRPIIRVNFSSHIFRERRVRPICRTFDQATFHRIPVNVIGVGREIGIVADLVVPEAVLPESVLSSADLSRRHHIAVDQMLTCVGRDSFYVSPTLRKVGVPGGQGPDGVEMVGKQNPGINAERMRVASFCVWLQRMYCAHLPHQSRAVAAR